MQILDALPPHLAIPVLQSSGSSPLSLFLKKLPQPHHPLVLQARFPSIAAEQQLEISPVSLATLTDQSQVLSRVMRAAGALTCLRSLNLGMFSVSHAFSYSPPRKHILCESFISMLQRLTQLTKLDMGSSEALSSGLGDDSCYNSLLPSVAVRLAQVLPRMTKLRALRLECRREMGYLGCQELLEGLQSCSNLQSLTMRGVAIVSAAAANTSRRYPEQHFSWHRQDGTGRLTAAWRCGTAEVAAGECTGTWAFGAALACMTGLQSLTCSRVYLDQVALRPIKDVLLHAGAAMLQTLTKLSFAGSTFNSPTHHRYRRTVTNAQSAASSWDLKDLAAVLRRLAALEHIDLNHCGLTPGRAKILAPAFRKLQQLRHVDLGINFLGYNGIESCSTSWRRLQHVSWLSLANAAGGWNHRFQPERDRTAVVHLMGTIRMFKNLKNLDLTDFPVTTEYDDSCAHALADSLGQSSSLCRLAVECGSWRGPTMHALMHALSSHTDIQSLSLCDNLRRYPPAVSCTEAIASFGRCALRLSSSMPALTHLSIRCGADVVATAAVASALRALTGLESLDLNGLRVTDKATSLAIAHGLCALTRLTRLSLVRGGIKSTVAAPMAAELGKLTQITYIALSIDCRNPEGDDVVLEQEGEVTVVSTNVGLEAETLAAEIAGLPDLKNLNMSGSVLSKAGCVAIVRALLGAGSELNECFLSSDDYAMVSKRRRRREILDMSWVRIRAHYDAR